MDKLQLTGRYLGRVFNFSFGHLHAVHFWCYQVKLPNLKLITSREQLLASLPLIIVLHRWVSYSTSKQKMAQCRGQASSAKMTSPVGKQTALACHPTQKVNKAIALYKHWFMPKRGWIESWTKSDISSTPTLVLPTLTGQKLPQNWCGKYGSKAWLNLGVAAERRRVLLGKLRWSLSRWGFGPIFLDWIVEDTFR